MTVTELTECVPGDFLFKKLDKWWNCTEPMHVFIISVIGDVVHAIVDGEVHKDGYVAADLQGRYEFTVLRLMN